MSIDLSTIPDAVAELGTPVWQPEGWLDVKGNGTWTPVGIMVHHTAMTVPLSVRTAQGDNRFGGPLCNFVVRAHARQVDCIGGGYAYDSGPGSGRVLDEVRQGIAPSGTARERGLADTINGNPWYVDVEVDFPGDGGELSIEGQLGLLDLLEALCRLTGWSASRIVGHKEHTRRKIDPNWQDLDMNAIRAEVAARLEAPAVELFEFRDDGSGGAWKAADIGLVEKALEAWDESVIVALEKQASERGRGIRLYMTLPDPNFSAIAMPVGNISFSTKLSGTDYFTSVAAHEVGHIIDSWLLDNAQRNKLIDIMCSHSPQHEWGRTSEPYYLHVREALAELIAEFYGYGGLPFFYQHSDGLSQEQREDTKAYLDTLFWRPPTRAERVAAMKKWAREATSAQSFIDSAPVAYNFAIQYGKDPMEVYQEMHGIAHGGIWQDLAREVASWTP